MGRSKIQVLYKENLHCDGTARNHDDNGTHVHGCWHADESLIRVEELSSAKERLGTLLHEWYHAHLDKLGALHSEKTVVDFERHAIQLADSPEFRAAITAYWDSRK